MASVVEVATNGVRVPLAAARVEEAAHRVLQLERVRGAHVGVTFVSDRVIASLNWRHLRHRGTTDVIAFGFEPVDSSRTIVGEIYIAPGVARRNARRHGERLRHELLRLVVHGLLNVIGHDHPDGEGRYASPMWRRQERMLREIVGTE